MNDLNERLDYLREHIQTKDFLEGKGLGNEANIHFFCYNAKDEMAVKHFIKQITEDYSLKCNLFECKLYKMFIEICNDLDILDSIPEIEESEGSEFLLEQLHHTIEANDYIERIKELNDFRVGDIILLTEVGEVFPFIRIHKLLENMQSYFSNVPILIFYPGTFNGTSVKLFDKLKPNAYYRAFNII